MFSFPRRIPEKKLTTKIFVSGLIEIPDNTFEFASLRQEFQLAEYAPTKFGDPTVGLHQMHELHQTLATSNKNDRLGPIQVQNILEAHQRLGHIDVRKCAHFLGVRLRDSLSLNMQCSACMEGKSEDHRAGPARAATTDLLSRVTIDSVGPFQLLSKMGSNISTQLL
jgi:hypothetical protein